MRTQPRQPEQVTLPPQEDWATFYAKEQRRNRQGRHKGFFGPTQSGKTVLCRLEARLRRYVVVFGTKAVDRSLDEYIAEGYVRIDHWPPTRHETRENSKRNGGAVRWILWPKIKTRADLRAPRTRELFLRCFDQAFMEGCWTIVVDETLWACSRDGLDMDAAISSMAFGSASNDVSMYFVLQRPAGVSRIIWANVSDAYIFHSGVRDDLRELASLGTYPPNDVSKVISTIGRSRKHEFLYLPCRAEGEWAVSEARL